MQLARRRVQQENVDCVAEPCDQARFSFSLVNRHFFRSAKRMRAVLTIAREVEIIKIIVFALISASCLFGKPTEA